MARDDRPTPYDMFEQNQWDTENAQQTITKDEEHYASPDKIFTKPQPRESKVCGRVLLALWNSHTKSIHTFPGAHECGQQLVFAVGWNHFVMYCGHLSTDSSTCTGYSDYNNRTTMQFCWNRYNTFSTFAVCVDSFSPSGYTFLTEWGRSGHIILFVNWL